MYKGQNGILSDVLSFTEYISIEDSIKILEILKEEINTIELSACNKNIIILFVHFGVKLINSISEISYKHIESYMDYLSSIYSSDQETIEMNTCKSECEGSPLETRKKTGSFEELGEEIIAAKGFSPGKIRKHNSLIEGKQLDKRTEKIRKKLHSFCLFEVLILGLKQISFANKIENYDLYMSRATDFVLKSSPNFIIKIINTIEDVINEIDLSYDDSCVQNWDKLTRILSKFIKSIEETNLEQERVQILCNKLQVVVFNFLLKMKSVTNQNFNKLSLQSIALMSQFTASKISKKLKNENAIAEIYLKYILIVGDN